MGPYPGGNRSVLNITAATVVKATSGVLVTVSVFVAGSAAGAAYDLATNTPAAANEIGVIPNAVGLYEFQWPCSTGILIVPGTGQSVSVSYS